MAHFAELDENNTVIYVAYIGNEVITDKDGNEVEQLGIDHLHKHHGADRRWVRTSYNGNFRGRYAGLGYVYREDIDKFVEPQPYPSWVLNTDTGLWQAPVDVPSEYFREDYLWTEESQSWFSIHEYVYEKYGKDYQYSDIQNVVEKYNLVDKEGVAISDTEDYTLYYQKIKNMIVSHIFYKKVTASSLENWRQDYNENISKLDCDVYAIKFVNSDKERELFHKYVSTCIGAVFLEEKNNFVIYRNR